MRKTCALYLAAVCAVAVSASIVFAQGAFHFEDNFNRDPWENAQTNAALPDWSKPGSGGTSFRNRQPRGIARSSAKLSSRAITSRSGPTAYPT